jgi:hypothetical protein
MDAKARSCPARRPTPFALNQPNFDALIRRRSRHDLEWVAVGAVLVAGAVLIGFPFGVLPVARCGPRGALPRGALPCSIGWSMLF